jgi:hypothetical protein
MAEYLNGPGSRIIRMGLLLPRGQWRGPSGLFAPDRLGFNLAWITLVYLSFQLLTIPLAVGARDRFISVLDGMASMVPLGAHWL